MGFFAGTLGEKIREGNGSSGAGGRNESNSGEGKQKVERGWWGRRFSSTQVCFSLPMPGFLSSNVIFCLETC